MAKKSKAKSRIKKTVKKRATSIKAKVNPELCFMAVDGSTINSLMELADALDRMSEDTFYYHVSEMRNDFATWIKDVFNELELAEKLLDSSTKDRHLIEVLKFVVNHK